MPDDAKRPPGDGGRDSQPGSGASDVAVLGAPTETGVPILRMRQGQVEVGELRAAPEGKPILGESVRLHARADHAGLYDVETIARGPLARQPRADAPMLPARKGPAKVATAAYRSGWDSIFQGRGGKPGDDLPN